MVQSIAPLSRALLLLPVLGVTAQAQATPAELIQNFRWRNIGPANMMGRIAAIDALDEDYRTVLMGSASGGVFKSTNAGTTWTPIFDSYGSGSIGDVAFFQPDPDIIWVATGESANRNSSGWGDGIYKSTDGGRTFQNMGLRDTAQIAEIAVHPSDPDIVYAAAIGHLWGYSGSRGLFRTTDGGETWAKLNRGLQRNGLPDDDMIGCTEIIMHPDHPDILFAGMYHRIRRPATFHSGSPDGGIYKSTDAGATWRKLIEGLPTGETGMIDISIHRADANIMVVNVEADQRLPDDLSVPGPGVYISRDRGETWRYLLRHNTRPFYHGQIEIDPIDPQRIFVVSRNFRVTTDGGETWGGSWWGGGGDDHDFWMSPADNSIFYTATDQGAHLSIDNGETVLSFNNMAIGQYYAIGVDMRDPYWVIGGLQDNGIWMGPSNSRENRGILNDHNTWVAEGDGFHSHIDPTDWRTVYTVNHVGFVARQNIETRQHTFITPTAETIINFLDYIEDDEEEPTQYTIAPGEHWFFRDRPERPVLPAQFRFNWSSPFILSSHNPTTVYFAGNYLFKSIDRGNTWRIISPDLTTNDEDLRNPTGQGGLTTSVTGDTNYCTVITIGESPIDPSVLWVGTDDGNIQLTFDGGTNWVDVTGNLDGIPERTWVSRLEPSHFNLATAYATLDNHRHDDTRPYVLKTDNYGGTWTDISANLPEDGSVYVIREDRNNPDLLFVGTEFGVYVSVNGGGHWQRLNNNLPTVAIHDLVIHPRDNDLVAGTHGRSIWIADDITPLQQLTPEILTTDAHLFGSRVATRWVRIDLGRKQPDFQFRGENPPPGGLIHFYLKVGPTGPVTLEIRDPQGDRTASVRVQATAGINRARWNLRFPSTAAERRAHKQHLRRVIENLQGLVDEDHDWDQLIALSRMLSTANDDGSLNEVRSELVRDFNEKAPGRPFFGERIGPTDAPRGTYRVLLTVNGETLEGSITVREDPLHDNR